MYPGKPPICIMYFSHTITYYRIRYILWVTLWAKFTFFAFHSVAPAYSKDGFDTWSFLMTILHQLQYQRITTEYQILHHFELEYWFSFYITESSLLLLMTRRYLMKTA